MKKYVVVFVLLCFSVSLAVPATGQKNQAASLFDQGVTALKQHHYREALNAFKEAYDLSPHWAVLAHIGTCYAKLDEPIKAIRVLKQYLKDGGEKIPQDERNTAKALLKEQEEKVGTLVLSVKKGVRAKVDGKSVGTAPFDEIPLRAGTHLISIIFAEDDVIERNIEIEGGQEFMLRIKEEERSPAVKPAPMETVEEEEEEEPEEEEPEEEEPEEEDVPRGEGSLVPFYVSLGVAAAGLVGGGVGWGYFAHYRISANNYQAVLDDFYQQDPAYLDYTFDTTCTGDITSHAIAYYCNKELNRQDFQDKSDLWLIVGIAGSGVAVVAGTLAIIFYINRHWFAKGGDDFGRISITPLVGRHNNGLVLSLSF